MTSPACPKGLVYAWQDAAKWHYTASIDLAPQMAVVMELLKLGDELILRHPEDGTIEVIWGAKEFVPA